jgi:thiosulfate dehydrogenase [quinone] large subunit
MATTHDDGQLRPAVAAWTLLPLRLFLGLTFVDAGAGKLLAPAWFGAGPQGFAAQTRQFTAGSPIGGLLHGAVAAHPLPFGFGLAIGELAVGLLILAGLATRVAAAAGLGLSLLFFLTASWHVRPFFYGPDLPFAVAWLPLVLAGDAGLPSLDRALRRRARREQGLAGDGGLVAVPADQLREVCRSTGCSWAELCRLSAPADGQAAAVASRRGFLASLGAAGLVVGGATIAGGVLAGAAAMASPQVDQSPRAGAPRRPPASSSAPAASHNRAARRGPSPPSGQRIGDLGQIGVGQAVAFSDPASGLPAVAVRLGARQVVAYQAVCTHAGCTVGFDPTSGLLACPCHGAEFDPRHAGAVVTGPAPTPLAPVRITVGPDDGLYTSP